MSDMSARYEEIITGFPLFQGYTVQGAHMLLESGQVKQHTSGELLFKEGDAPTCVLLVLTGKLEVFVERQGRDLVLTLAEPGTILGELAVLCGSARSASVRARESSAVLHWTANAFRRMLLQNSFLSERIFAQSLRNLVEKERSLIDSLMRSQGFGNHAQ
jgi:CRP-like cAMP-binding protein